MREHKPHGPNVSAAPGSESRFRTETIFLKDETTGLSERPVQIGRKNFRVLAASEMREGYSALRIARVKRSADGVFTADSTFVPPLLNVHANPYLLSITRRLVEVLAARSSQISGQLRHKNTLKAEFTASDIVNFWLLYTINSSFPRLNHLLETKRSHPEHLFAAMLDLAGALTTFAPDISPAELPKYDHDDLAVCFHELDSAIRVLLETVAPVNFIALPLKYLQPSMYGAALDDDRYFKGTHFYLAMSSDANQADLIARVPQLAKVCSANHLGHLVRQALPGAPLTYVPNPPSSISVKLNYKYFSISTAGLAWEAVLRSQNLAVYVPEDFPNPQLELVILLPPASSNSAVPRLGQGRGAER